MNLRPNHAREIRAALTDARALCGNLGLIGTHGSYSWQPRGAIVRCPWHGEKTPSCSVRTAGDGTIAVKCFGCGETSDALGLIAIVRGFSLSRDFPLVLLEAAQMAGLWGIVHELESGSVDAAAPRPSPPKPLAPAPRDYPPADEVAALAGRLVAPSSDDEAAAWIRSRGLDPERVDELADVGVLPVEAPLPRWAAYRGDLWTTTGHRLVVAMRDALGAIRSVRGCRIVDGDSPKRLPPGGHKASELVMACELAAGMLAGTFSPKRLLVVEGEPDFLVAATWAMRVPTARIGIVSGSWSPAFAARVPVGTEVLLWTDRDRAGDTYAAQIVATLQRARGCHIRRWNPEGVAA